MSLIIDEGELEIEEATLVGIVPDPYWCKKYNRDTGKELYWYLTISTEDRDIDGVTYQAQLYHQSLPIQLRNWRDFAGRELTWDSTDGSEIPDCGLSLWEHEEIPIASLRFLQQNGAAFDMKWSGVSDLRPFDLTATIAFNGIEVRGNERDSDESMLERLSQFVDPNDYESATLEVADFKYATGLRTAQSHFKPKL